METEAEALRAPLGADGVDAEMVTNDEADMVEAELSVDSLGTDNGPEEDEGIIVAVDDEDVV